MPLTIINVSYPFAAVGPDAIGGAEQILATLDAALARAGHRSIVVAPEGSEVAGTLLPVPTAPAPIDNASYARVHQHTRDAIRTALDRWPVDVVHFHGVDFDAYLPPVGPAALATLHLPLHWFKDTALKPSRPTRLTCVSTSQRDSFGAAAAHLDVIPNGVDVPSAEPAAPRQGYALAMGRICPEKGYAHALDAARLAGTPLILAGHVFPYPLHRRYFDDEIAPRLDGDRRFIGPACGEHKRMLLRHARCVLVPSVAPETSSLIVMEALASGTPVIAFPSGALAELVDDGVTGFLVQDANAMAEAIRRIDDIDPRTCVTVARERFSATRMVARYLDLYERLASTSH